MSAARLDKIKDTVPANRLVNNSEVSMIAKTAIRFLPLFIRIKRFVSRRSVSLFSTFTMRMPPFTAGYDSAVLYPKNSVCKLCNLFIMSNHDNRLVKLVTGHLKKPQHVLACAGVKVAGRLIRNLYPNPSMLGKQGF